MKSTSKGFCIPSQKREEMMWNRTITMWNRTITMSKRCFNLNNYKKKMRHSKGRNTLIEFDWIWPLFHFNFLHFCDTGKKVCNQTFLFWWSWWGVQVTYWAAQTDSCMDFFKFLQVTEMRKEGKSFFHL